MKNQKNNIPENSIFIHEIKLPEKDDFSRKFNDVSDSFAKSNDKSLSDKEREDHYQSFIHKKSCLELGIG